jgi:hypothetical protein
MKYLLCLLVLLIKPAFGQNKVKDYYADLNSSLKEFAITKDTASYLSNQYDLAKEYGSLYIDLSFRTKIIEDFYTVFGERKTRKFISILARKSIVMDSYFKTLSESKLFGSDTFYREINLTKIINKNSKYYDKLFSNYNLFNSVSANSFYDPDQLARHISGDYNCVNKSNISNVIYYSDSLNLIRLYHLLEDQGFPKSNNVGAFGYFILFFHTIARPCNYQFELPNGKNAMQYFDSVLLKEVELGNFDNHEYGFFVDEALTYSSCGKFHQTYGVLYRETKDIYPIMNIETVDERRAQIFLPPLWVDSINYGFELPKEYPLPLDYLELIK